MLLTYVITQKNQSASLDQEGDLEMNPLVAWFYSTSVNLVEWPLAHQQDPLWKKLSNKLCARITTGTWSLGL